MFPIDHLNRYVSNVDAFVEFYCDILGYRVLTRGIKANGQPFAVLGGAGHELYVSEREDFAACKDGNFRHVGYAVEDADALLADLKGKGFAANAEIIVKPWSRQFYLSDPDGFVIDMIQWTDREGRDKAWEGRESLDK